MQNKIIWIGNRESELLYSDLCCESCTIYGSNKNENNTYKNSFNCSIVDFFVEYMRNKIKQDAYQFLFYSNFLANRVKEKAPELKGCIINQFNSELLKFIDDKTYCHLLANNWVPIIEFTEVFGANCTYKNLHSKFPDYKKFIIQENHSSGGLGTFLLTEENEQYLSKSIKSHMCYLVSPYYQNSFSINTHIIITSDKVYVLPYSIQIVENIDNHLMYKGADYIAYKKISSKIRETANEYAYKIGNILRNTGYKGIIGLDLLVKDDNLYFLEINPRFQASTILINKALKEHDFPDLQTIVYNIYSEVEQSQILKKIEKIDVKYSTLSFYQNADNKFNAYILNRIKSDNENIECVVEENTDASILNEYMFRVIFKTNISSVNYDGEIFVYQNLLNYSKYNLDTYKKSNTLLKCALLAQGLTIEKNVFELYDKDAIKKATFDAVDIIINKEDNELIINCPTNTKFVKLSPFSIKKLDNRLGLFYMNQYLYDVTLSLQEKLPIKNTNNGIFIHRIGYLTTDRLRIKHNSNCIFKKQGLGCKFCHITSNYTNDFALQDIHETIDCYSQNVNFRHYLIGGPSNTYEKEEEYISKIIEYIRKKSNKPIYVMTVPPNPNTIDRYFKLGVNEVAFNIEIFDRKIARDLMPGKGEISIEQYKNALEKSSKLFGIENTRSMLLIGLDSYSSLLNGIEFLCDIGATPMLSPFRPMANTELSDFVPPTIDYCYSIYLDAKGICEKHGIELGPKCKYCCNNTLT